MKPGEKKAKADAAERDAQVLREEDALDLASVLATPQGRRLYARIVYRVCGLEAPSYAPSAQYMAFLEGRRDVAQTLMQEALEHAPLSWVQLYAERTERARAARAAPAAAATTATEGVTR